MGYREFYESGKSLDRQERVRVLKACLAAVSEKKEDILAGLMLDLGILKPQCRILYFQAIERPLKMAVEASRNALKPTWGITAGPCFLSLTRSYYESYGLVLIRPDSAMPFLYSYAAYLLSLAHGNCTVLQFSGRETVTSALLTKLTNGCVPGDFGCIVCEGDGGMDDPDLVLGGCDLSDEDTASAGKAVAVLDATADLDRSAEKIVHAWKKTGGLTEIAPCMVLVPSALRGKFVRNFDKWHWRKAGADAPEKMPVIGYKNEAELEKILGGGKKLSALYIFSNDKTMREKLILKMSFYVGCVNGTSFRRHDPGTIKRRIVRKKTLTVR